jgi:enamine deaminase RidA (YjgF/YER057c/UK114 family)
MENSFRAISVGTRSDNVGRSLIGIQPAVAYPRAINHNSKTQHEEAHMSFDARIEELNLQLPEAPKPGGTYTPLVIVDGFGYVSGHGPLQLDGSMMTGKVGGDLTEADGILAARTVGLTILATLKAQLGSLDRIERLVKVLGMVNATPDFGTHPKVINGFSDLMVEVFGENGRAARSAVGMGSLPGNIAVEIEVIIKLKD